MAGELRDALWGRHQLALLYDTIFREVKVSKLTPGSTAVGTTSATVVPANTNRKYLTIVNDGDSNLYLSIGTTAILGKGIPLLPGGCFEMNLTNLMTGAVTGITSIASMGACWSEGV
jgi:hypothetical protein